MSEAVPKSSIDGRPRHQPLKRPSPAVSRFRRALPFGIAASVLAVLAHLTPFAHEIENRYGLGLLFSLRRPVPPPDGALVIAIDRQSIDWLRQSSANLPEEAPRLDSCIPAGARAQLERLKGPSSLPRSVYACLLRELSRLGVPVAVFDIMFSVPGLPEDDKMLAEAMRDHGATAILTGLERFAISKGGAGITVEQEKQAFPLIKESAAATGIFLVPRTQGFVHGYLRHARGLSESPSLIEVAQSLLDERGVAAGSRERHQSDFTYLWLYGPPGSIRTVPLRDFLTGEVPDDVRRAAARTVAFVGASDPSMVAYEDSFPSLYRNETDANISGVELAATAFLNLQTGHELRLPPWPLQIGIVFAFALALGLVATMAGASSVWAIAGLATMYLMAAFAAFAEWRLFLPVFVPIFVAAPIVTVLALVVRSRAAWALVKRLAPAPVARRLLNEPSRDRGEVVTSDATVAFFDIIGSTKLGEQIPDIPFGELMNDFHDAVTREVEACGGCVIAFAGDGMTALFGSSEAGPDHAFLACRSAISSVRQIRSLNVENAKRGIPPLGVRVGMNSGQVAEGSIGARDRFNFAVVGDAVNIASRLEQLGKTLFPNDQDVILVASATHQRASGRGLSFVACGAQKIPGRASDEFVFRLLAH